MPGSKVEQELGKFDSTSILTNYSIADYPLDDYPIERLAADEEP